MTENKPVSAFGDTDLMSEAHARELGLSADEWERAKEVLGRTPNKVELGCFSAMWSEHCSYKTSRLHLGKLPSKGPRVVVGPGENAGVVDVGEGWGVCFKVESHNHPSFIEPYQGAATGAGGILRDVFTMGARPIAAANLFRFGRADHPRTPHLMRGVVKGVGDYGNCFGVPTVWTDAHYVGCYDGNILVNAFALGVVRNDRIFKGRAEGVGNPVLYVGAKTGRDGIHGATMASDSFSDDKEAERPTVQVGDPFKEKLLLEACLECFKTDALIGIQDMGAAGLTSSSFEMASRTGAGVRMDLDKIPAREKGMTAYELMLSESQERMLLVAKKGREDEVRAIFSKWELDAVTVGEVTDDGMVRLFMHGEEVGVLPARELADEAPKYDRPHTAPKAAGADPRVEQATTLGLRAMCDRVLGMPDHGDREWIYRQYDREVLVGTLADGMQAAAAVVQVPETNKAVAITLVSDDHAGALDPREGARRTVAQGVLRVAAVGAAAIGLSDCLNYGNPQKPEVMHELVEGIEGLAEACRFLEVPVVSGNVSLYNDTDGRSIHPTPGCAVVGLLEDKDARCGMALPEGTELWRLGEPSSSLEGSSALSAVGVAPRGLGLNAWRLDDVALLSDKLIEGIERGRIVAARPVADGGLLVAVAEMVRAGKRGANISLSTDDPLAELLGQSAPAVVVAIPKDRRGELESACVGLACRYLGTVEGDGLVIGAGGETLVYSRADLDVSLGRSLARIASAREGNA